jgi:hypothetical protein
MEATLRVGGTVGLTERADSPEVRPCLAGLSPEAQ